MPRPKRYAEFMGWTREELVERISTLEADHYVPFDFAGHLEGWMKERGFAATAGASFVDLLDELSAQLSSRPRN